MLQRLLKLARYYPTCSPVRSLSSPVFSLAPLVVLSPDCYSFPVVCPEQLSKEINPNNYEDTLNSYKIVSLLTTASIVALSSVFFSLVGVAFAGDDVVDDLLLSLTGDDLTGLVVVDDFDLIIDGDLGGASTSCVSCTTTGTVSVTTSSTGCVSVLLLTSSASFSWLFSSVFLLLDFSSFSCFSFSTSVFLTVVVISTSSSGTIVSGISLMVTWADLAK